MQRRHALAALCLLPAMSAGLAGCSRAEPLRVALHPWIGYEALFLARALGRLAPSVQLHETAQSGESLAALRDGRADAAGLTLDEVLRARDGGLDLTVALVFDVSAGADMVLARPPVVSLPDLQGRRVGLERSGLGDLMLAKALELGGLPPEAVTWLDVPPSSQVQAWMAGEVDAVVTYEPTASALMRLGAQPIFDSRRIPDTIFDVLAVRRDRLPAVDRALREAVQGHFMGLDHLRSSRQDAAYRIASRQHAPLDDVLRALGGVTLPSLAGNRQFLSETSRVWAAIDALESLMRARGYLGQAVDRRHLLSAEWLPDRDPGA